MEFSSILPVLTLVIGWFLNEASKYLGFRREKRGAIAQAIADLLEIRHQMVSIRTIVEQMTKKFNLPSEVSPIIKEFYKNLFPVPTDLSGRYENAVTLISSSDPILGFELRSKNLIADYISKLSLLASQDVETRTILGDFEDKLEKMIIPELEDSILELTKKHSLITWYRVRRLLNKKQEIPEQLEKLWREFQEKFERQQNVGNITNRST
jgi:hypothetical protein